MEQAANLRHACQQSAPERGRKPRAPVRGQAGRRRGRARVHRRQRPPPARQRLQGPEPFPTPVAHTLRGGRRAGRGAACAGRIRCRGAARRPPPPRRHRRSRCGRLPVRLLRRLPARCCSARRQAHRLGAGGAPAWLRRLPVAARPPAERPPGLPGSACLCMRPAAQRSRRPRTHRLEGTGRRPRHTLTTQRAAAAPAGPGCMAERVARQRRAARPRRPAGQGGAGLCWRRASERPRAPRPRRPGRRAASSARSARRRPAPRRSRLRGSAPGSRRAVHAIRGPAPRAQGRLSNDLEVPPTANRRVLSSARSAVDSMSRCHAGPSA